jgi:predicted acyltransferase (DUF342 family)
MREERGQVSGDVVVYEPYTLWGSVGGNVKVIERGKLYVRGAIYGNLTVEYGGRCHIFGRVTGHLTVHRGAKVIHSGILGGDVINEGGRLYIDKSAKIVGKLKTRRGETTIAGEPVSPPGGAPAAGDRDSSERSRRPSRRRDPNDPYGEGRRRYEL